MAETPRPTLNFTGDCPDCGGRSVTLPPALPEVVDDLDWRARDFDGFRRIMLEELAARFPDRRRWTPADMEVVIIEVLATVLDQLSDMADRVSGEAFLETARRPDSVRRLLSLIGYDAVKKAYARKEIHFATETELEKFWSDNPFAMNRAREAGPLAVRDQHRMVTPDDYGSILERHPLVLRASAVESWSGSWETINVLVIAWQNIPLDEPVNPSPDSAEEEGKEERLENLRNKIDAFHSEQGLLPVNWELEPTVRTILRVYVDRYRMSAQEVFLNDAKRVGITIVLSIVVNPNYFQSEVRRAAEEALGDGPRGFFATDRLSFGADLFASDLITWLMALDGVDNVCLIRFKRAGKRYPDRADSDRIVLSGTEIAVCDNDRSALKRGYFSVSLHGGRNG